jgi:hypothetical protein
MKTWQASKIGEHNEGLTSQNFDSEDVKRTRNRVQNKFPHTHGESNDFKEDLDARLFTRGRQEQIAHTFSTLKLP